MIWRAVIAMTIVFAVVQSMFWVVLGVIWITEGRSINCVDRFGELQLFSVVLDQGYGPVADGLMFGHMAMHPLAVVGGAVAGRRRSEAGDPVLGRVVGMSVVALGAMPTIGFATQRRLTWSLTLLDACGAHTLPLGVVGGFGLPLLGVVAHTAVAFAAMYRAVRT